MQKTIIGKFESINPRLARKYIFAGKYVKEKKVLDLGCASGYGSYYLAATAKAGSVIGVDISRKAIDYANKEFQSSNLPAGEAGLKFQIANAQELPFESNLFDVVVSLEVVEHVASYQRYLSEIKRVLKPKGTAIISTPNKAVTSPNLKYPLMVSHTKEFYIEELAKELKKYFSKVTLRGEDAAQGDLEAHLKTWRGKLQKIVSQNPLVRWATRLTPQALNDLFTGGKAVPPNTKLADVRITPSPKNAMTILAVCKK